VRSKRASRLAFDAASGESQYDLSCYYSRAGKKTDARKNAPRGHWLDAKLALQVVPGKTEISDFR
jgi:hypothetical protein